LLANMRSSTVLSVTVVFKSVMSVLFCRTSRRYVVLVVDDRHIEARNLLRIKKALDRFLDRDANQMASRRVGITIE
jgi:hypothetical protein